ncbi:hypothetical protein EV646_108332 [Kribbella antiqua]|uniref:Catalytic LigB subunit of aromatic ring-opening dioxygenase n=1 Tax=Kribbella antiqua TaxID=2512217 RepID=A0A4R2INY6_9ACTN|nr:class III extradiol dioxygenase subunit B-like domain-containing protein [Kribbella antiqua]TCO45709.1 hypothetical protein EV646_108332 [Kribbella antiqua]
MPVIAAAVCPHPPLLVPEVASGAAPELDDLRAACLAAIEHLSTAELLLVLGAGPSQRYDGSAGWSFAPYGAAGVRAGESVLPLSLAIGAWLVEQSKAAAVPRVYVAVDEASAKCLELGREIAAGNERIGLLVMGDGSARRSEHSPVHLHPRAEIFDTTVATALAEADHAVLAALDPDLATELQAAGRAPWQVLAGVLQQTPLTGTLSYHAAPYGVGYFVATFT